MLKWTYEACYEEAKKYTTRTEFHDKNKSAYQVACKNKWIEEYTWLERKHKPNGYWTYENCFNEALKCKSRGELCKKNGTVSRIAKQNNWIDDYIWLKDERFDLINDKIDCVYAYEFIEQNTVYVGRTLMRLKNRRDLEHIFSNDSVSKFAKENNIPVPEMKILEDNLTIKEGAENEGIWLELYKEDGWKILNIAKTGSIGRIGHRFSKYTYEVCYELAKNCHSKKEFEKYNASAYHIAYKNKWLDDYIWFISYSKPRGYWNYEHCYEEAKKYSTLTEFKKNNNAAYQQARKNNWIEKYTWIKQKIVKRGFWQIHDNCLEEAKKYKTRKQFQIGNSSAYTSAIKHGWLDEFFPKTKKK